jgi:hypothetical protein
VDAAAEFGPGAFTSVSQVVRGEIRRDPGSGIRDTERRAVFRARRTDPVRVDAMVSGGVTDQVGQGLVEAEQRPDLLPGAVRALRAGQHVGAAA